MKVFVLLLFAHTLVMNSKGMSPVEPRTRRVRWVLQVLKWLVLCLLSPVLLYLVLMVHGYGSMILMPFTLGVGLIGLQGVFSLGEGTLPEPESLGSFLGYHGAHLILYAAISVGFDPPPLPMIGPNEWNVLLVATGGLALVGPVGHFVYLSLKRYAHQIGDENELTGAGKTIGQLERLIIYILYLTDYVGVIGFLIAAKSILRFGEIRDQSPSVRKHTEYVIIGTLWSFLLSLLISWTVGRFL